MSNIVLMLVWPYLRRYLFNRAADQVAGVLNRHRSRRLQVEEEPAEMPSTEMAECPPCPPTLVGYSSSDLFWFTMSGVLLGSALGVLLSYLARQED